MIISLHPKNPEPRKLQQIVDALRKGAVIIYPTDTVYGMGCDIEHPEAIDRICKIKNINPLKAQLSFLCSDLSHLSEYTKPISTPMYRWVKQYVPGPYTFIMEANKKVPKLLKTKKDTVGIRVPINPISHAILEALGRPVLSTSLPLDEESDILTDPEIIYHQFHGQVDIIVDGGIGGSVPSTILDCTQYPPEIIRQGAGEVL